MMTKSNAFIIIIIVVGIIISTTAPVRTSKNFRVSTDQQRNVRESGRSNESVLMEEYLESKKFYNKIQEELKTKQKNNKFPTRDDVIRGGADDDDDDDEVSDVNAVLPFNSTAKSEIHEHEIINKLPEVITSTNKNPLIQPDKEDTNNLETAICHMFQTNGFITGEHSNLCMNDFNGVMAALVGARLGLLECSHQFQFERWNCSVSSPHFSVLIEHGVVDENHDRTPVIEAPVPDDSIVPESSFLPNKNIKVADLRMDRQFSKNSRNAKKGNKFKGRRQFRRSVRQGEFISTDVKRIQSLNMKLNEINDGMIESRKNNEVRLNKKKLNKKTKVGNMLKKSEHEAATKETAFIYAITSAGVAYSVTESCSAGNLTDCSCLAGPGTLSTTVDNSRKPRYSEVSPRSEDDGWKWGGCSDNIEFGLRYAEMFTDVPEKAKQNESMNLGRRRDIKSLVNLHNNEVGRKVLFSLMKMKCRCHGVSGSCGVRTCWRSLPNFREVGDTLKKKYESSVEISPKLPTLDIPSSFGDNRKNIPDSDGKNVLLRREKRRRREPISDTELVYVEKSPNYCRRDPNKGITGTKGRICRRDSDGPESCQILCCGRGYRVEIVKSVERCNCRFVWCCTVQCRTCEKVEKRYTCK